MSHEKRSLLNFGSNSCVKFSRSLNSHYSAAETRRCMLTSARGKGVFYSLLRTMLMTTLVNRIRIKPDELALIRSEPISMQWANELRRSTGLHPSCKLLRELLSLDPYTRTVVYPFLIKGWSSSRIAERLKVSVITIQTLLENGREQLKRKLGARV
jgi:DNA-directed RNA polymerase specialized sigma24 family protein